MPENKSEFPELDEYLLYLDDQQQLSFLFNEHYIGKFIYSKKCYFQFDKEPLLWSEVEKDEIIDVLSTWLRNMRRHYTKQRDEMEEDKSISQDKKKEFNKLILSLEKKTIKMNDYNALLKVMKFFKVRIMDNTFYDKLNRACPYHLPIKNCLLIDLRTGKTRVRCKTDYFTYICNAEYTTTKTDFFKKFISSIMCDNEDNLKYFQKMLGYTLTGDIAARVFFIWWGFGANGKSIILNLMKEILGEINYLSVAKSVFINNGKPSGGPEIVPLKNCRLATFSETSANDCLNESLIKMITGNDDISCRALFKDQITFKPICKLILCTNHKPEFNGNDQANIDRVRFIPFNARFIDDEPKNKNEYKKILGIDKIIIDKYLNEFFSFCVDGAIEYYKNEQFNPPKEIEEAQYKYISEKASITNFINDTYEINKVGRIKKGDIKYHYEQYCRDNNIKQEKISLIHDYIIKLVGDPVKSSGIYEYKGLQKIIYPDEDDEPTIKSDLDL